jgi:hypothetical protein
LSKPPARRALRAKFEEMTVAQVRREAASEGMVQRGKPLYADRPWTQLHDEMVDAEATTVGDLPRSRVRALGAAIRE